jgi:hypothetical protein
MQLDIWNTGNSIRMLTTGRATNAYSARQFTGWLALVFVLEAIDSILGGTNSLLSTYHGVISAAVSLAGLAYCFWRNRANEFVTRFAVLALPLSVQLAIAYEVLYWSAYLLYPIVARDLGDTYYDGVWLTYDLLLPLVFTVIWFARMSWLMASVGTNPGGHPEASSSSSAVLGSRGQP